MLMQAAADGDCARLQKLIDDGACVYYREPGTGRTALHAAAEHGRREAIELLLENHHPWNAVDDAGVSAAEYAQRAGFKDLYDFMVREGIRTELLIRLLVCGFIAFFLMLFSEHFFPSS